MKPLAIALLGLTLCAASTQPPSEEGLVTAVYDTADVFPDLSREQVYLGLLPYLTGLESEYDEWDGLHEEFLTGLIEAVVGYEEFEYEDRLLSSVGYGQILIRAPEAVHVKVRRLLQNMSSAFHRQAHLTLTLYKLGVTELPSTLTEASAEQWEAQGLLVPLQVWEETLALGRTVTRRVEDVHQVLRGWDSEIAERSGAAAPIIRDLATGLVLALRLEDGGGQDRVRVRFAQRMSELRALESQAAGLRTVVALDTALRELSNEGTVDLTQVQTGVHAGSAAVNPGQSVFGAAMATTNAGAAGYALRIRLDSVEPPVAPLSFGDEAVAVLDGSRWAWPRLYLPEATLGSLRGARRGDSPEGYLEAEHQPLIFPSDELDEEHQGMAGLEPLTWLDEAWLQTINNWIVIKGPADVVREGWADFRSQLHSGGRLVLDVGIQGDPDGARLAARVRLPMERGDGALAVAGDAVSLVQGYETDVAQGTSISNPRIIDALDGMLVRGSEHGRREAVQVDVLNHRLLGVDEVDLRTAVSGYFQRGRFLTSDMSQTVPADGQRHVLGVLRVDGTQARVWARVTSQ